MNNKDIHMLKSYAGMTHKLTDNQGRPKLDQAIENVLSKYKEQQEIIKLKEEIEEKVKKLKSELETYKKIAEKLAYELCECDFEYHCEHCRTDICDAYEDNDKYKQCIIDWARKEVENGK